MKETYDKKVIPFRVYEGQRCYLFDPVTKIKECFKIRRKWRGPCYQGEDVQKDDEDIEDLPIVEVTYPPIDQAPILSAASQQTNRTPYPEQTTETRISENIQIPSTEPPMTAQEPEINDQHSTNARQGSISSDDKTESD